MRTVTQRVEFTYPRTTSVCMTCFHKYTAIPVINERVIAAYRLIADAESDMAFSSDLLHVIVADMNVDDWLFDLTDGPTRRYYDEASDWERAIFDGLASLSEPERATAVAMDWGYISPDMPCHDAAPIQSESPDISEVKEPRTDSPRS